MLRALLLIPGLILLMVAAFLILRPEPGAAALRDADRLWQAGRFAEARQRYLLLQKQPATSGIVHVRLAQSALLRGECAEALLHAATALQRPLRRDEAALVHLVAGQCASLARDTGRAEAAWASVDPRSSLRPLADVLRGEAAVAAGRPTEAATRYSTALQQTPPEPWQSLARLRIAQTEALEQPDAALSSLQTIGTALPSPTADMRPFAPLSSAQIVADARQLEAILRQRDPARMQLLGQYLLDRGLNRLAINAFERMPSAAPESVIATAYAAYARWQLGETAIATAQLRELATANPAVPVVATLYATVALRTNDLEAANRALDAAEARNPLDPAIALVRSDVFAARREYVRALAERRRARDLARADARGRYALALAQAYFDTTRDLCRAGQTAAQEATAIAPNDPAAWQTLAEARYHCRAYDQAADAAQRGLQIVPDSAALEFFLGASLWERGRREAARSHLLRAADLAPQSEWRTRAETLLGW